MATILKRCTCAPRSWKDCDHSWVVRYRTTGGRSGRQREESFGADKQAAKDFALKVEHDKRAHVFIDPKAGKILFRAYAETWLSQHLGTESTLATYRSLLRAHIYPALGRRPLNAISRVDIKNLIAHMRTQVGASRVCEAYLVIHAILGEAVLDKKIAESPCFQIDLPDIVLDKEFILPTYDQLEGLKAGLPADWAATIDIMYGCGLRIGEALAVNVRCRIAGGKTLRIHEQVNQQGQLRPLKFRKRGECRDIPLPAWVSDNIDRRIAQHGTTDDGYLFRGRKHKFVVRRTYQEDFTRAVRRAGLSAFFVPHSLRHCFASIALTRGVPITEVSRWLGHRNLETTHRIYGHLTPESWIRARTVLDTAYQDLRCSAPAS